VKHAHDCCCNPKGRDPHCLALSPALPPLPDGWVRCSERMPALLTDVQFHERDESTIDYGWLVDSGCFWSLARRMSVPADRVAAWRPLTVPDAVRAL
jgi:hypothetical protein